MYGTQRTGVRFVLTNPADPRRVGDFNDWYDAYGEVAERIGYLAKPVRFENPDAAGNDQDPRFAAVYDIVTSDPATAWPDTESSADYPALFDDPRSKLVVPAFRASYALVGAAQRPAGHGTLTGVYLALSTGGDDTVRQRWESQILETGLFYAVSRFRAIEGWAGVAATGDGQPEPPGWLEIFETDVREPLTAYARALAELAPELPDPQIRYHTTGAYRLVSAPTPSGTLLADAR
jgi:hypothetical protein